MSETPPCDELGLGAAAASASASPRPAGGTRALAAPSAAAAKACDPPYYFDARGIKKFKPECL